MKYRLLQFTDAFIEQLFSMEVDDAVYTLNKKIRTWFKNMPDHLRAQFDSGEKTAETVIIEMAACIEGMKAHGPDQAYQADACLELARDYLRESFEAKEKAGVLKPDVMKMLKARGNA